MVSVALVLEVKRKRELDQYRFSLHCFCRNKHNPVGNNTLTTGTANLSQGIHLMRPHTCAILRHMPGESSQLDPP